MWNLGLARSQLDWLILLVAKPVSFSALGLTLTILILRIKPVSVSKTWDYKNENLAVRTSQNCVFRTQVQLDWQLVMQFIWAAEESSPANRFFINGKSLQFNGQQCTGEALQNDRYCQLFHPWAAPPHASLLLLRVYQSPAYQGASAMPTDDHAGNLSACHAARIAKQGR